MNTIPRGGLWRASKKVSSSVRSECSDSQERLNGSAPLFVLFGFLGDNVCQALDNKVKPEKERVEVLMQLSSNAYQVKRPQSFGLSALPQEAQAHSLELGSWLALFATMMPPVPPWAVGNTPEPVSLDIDGFVDVSAYVRLEENLADINYGVLDIQVNFHT